MKQPLLILPLVSLIWERKQGVRTRKREIGIPLPPPSAPSHSLAHSSPAPYSLITPWAKVGGLGRGWEGSPVLRSCGERDR